MTTRTVPSDRNPATRYVLSYHADGSISCTCADYLHRSKGNPAYLCKHGRRNPVAPRFTAEQMAQAERDLADLYA